MWKKKGIVVGEIVYWIIVPADKKSKSKPLHQPAENRSQEDGWCLSNTIQLSPSQAKQFLSFLEQNEARLKETIATESEEQRRILGKVYSLILNWRWERKMRNTLITSSKDREPKPAEKSGVCIPQGRYFTVWLKQEQLHGV